MQHRKTVVISKMNQSPKASINIDGTDIEQVNKFTYLWQLITEDGRCEEVKRRKAVVKTSFNKMYKVITSRDISLDTRKRILQCYVWSTFMYRVEMWTISGKNEKSIAAFEMWCYRRMLRIYIMDRKSKEWRSIIKNEHKSETE